MAYVQMDWPEDQLHTNFTVSCYSESKVVFLRDEANQVPDHGALLRKIFRSMALQQIDCAAATDCA
jgi:hypothetical protein